MKTILTTFITMMPFLSHSTSLHPDTYTNEVTVYTYENPLTIAGYCDNGQRIGNHHMNCIQWVKFNYKKLTGFIMLTDMPLPFTISTGRRYNTITINEFGHEFKYRFDVSDSDNGIIDQDGNVWYKR